MHLKGFAKNKLVRLFRITMSHGTNWSVTSDLAQNSAQVTQEISALRWKLEQLHQLIGIEQCQGRKGLIQRNHIACALLV